MTTPFDTALSAGLDSLLSTAGKVVQYYSDATHHEPITLRKCPQRPVMIDAGDGLTEVMVTDWIGRVADLPYGNPVRGHWIQDGTTVYPVQPLDGARCYFSPNPAQVRIHTKQTA